jgi:hypothetical protein
MSSYTKDTLQLKFNGRIIDHLGIQMYQSATAALAEFVANAWDANAENIWITLPASLHKAKIVIKDNGVGMTFAECESRYLNLGYCRRGNKPTETVEGNRPVLGRKGIGKLAGFGIAEIVEIDTISKKTGERTVFKLDLNSLRGDEYIGPGKKIQARKYPPNNDAKKRHGTTITLKKLSLKKRQNEEQFRTSMARRFLLLEWAGKFRIWVNKKPLPQDNPTGVEFEFPRDYSNENKPAGLSIASDGWGIEKLSNKQKVRWRIRFYENPIDEEELGGISVFAGVKLAQTPFYFNLTGGLGGQHGQEYVSGIVKADYLDELGEDIIATERQRINWEHPAAMPLGKWGQTRLKELLRLWKARRSEEKNKLMEQKISGFAQRLEKLPNHERRTVKAALTKIGGIEALSNQQFELLAQALLKAWEQGRLHELIDGIAQKHDLEAPELLELLAEADVLTALNIAEVVKTKLESVRGLKRLVKRRRLENKLRDYLAERPYLLMPGWETFAKETRVESILTEAAKDAGLKEKRYAGRLDLALSSHRQLLVIEFMRPGLAADHDHLQRCQTYISIINEKIRANSALNIEQVTGLIVADELSKKPGMSVFIQNLRQVGILAHDWDTLLKSAEAKLKEFLEIVAERAPNDPRLLQLKADADSATQP